MKKIRKNRLTALTMLFVLCMTATLASCGNKDVAVDSGASDYTASSDETTTTTSFTADEVEELDDDSDTSEEIDEVGDADETEETEIVTDESGETVTDENGDPETITVTTDENVTEAEEPEGTVTTEAQEEDETEGTVVSAGTTTKKSGSSTTTTTKKSETTTTSKKDTSTTTKKTETTTKNSEATTTTKNSETTTTTKAAETTTTAASTSTRTYATEEEKLAIIEGINNYRAEKGYTEMPVVLNTFLTDLAQEWADYLAANDLCENRMDDSGNDKITGEWVVWNREYNGTSKLLGKEISSWISKGESVGKSGFYEDPFVGVGVAVNSSGKTVLVVLGVSQITVYDSDGKWVYDDIGQGIDYDWYVENSDGSVEWYTEDSEYIRLVNKLYETGHFADFIPDMYYYLTYGDNYYKYIPSWMKGSASWLD